MIAGANLDKLEPVLSYNDIYYEKWYDEKQRWIEIKKRNMDKEKFEKTKSILRTELHLEEEDLKNVKVITIFNKE